MIECSKKNIENYEGKKLNLIQLNKGIKKLKLKFNPRLAGLALISLETTGPYALTC